MQQMTKAAKGWNPPAILTGYLNFRSDKNKKGEWLPNYEIIVYKDKTTGRPTRGDEIVLIDKASRQYKHPFTLGETASTVTMGKPKEHLRWMKNNGFAPTIGVYRQYHGHKITLNYTGRMTGSVPEFNI